MSVLTHPQQQAAAAQAAGWFGVPELKNPRYLACFKDGRRAHLKARWPIRSLTRRRSRSIATTRPGNPCSRRAGGR